MRIGVDLGGSHIAVGLVDDNGTIIETFEKNWEKEDRKDIRNSIKNAIIDISKKILNNNGYSFENVHLIGIGSPGTIIDGKMSNVNNLGIDVYDIRKAIQEEVDVKVSVRNDAKCAAICEKRYGAMKDYQDCVFLTLGTGIGGAVFLGR